MPTFEEQLISNIQKNAKTFEEQKRSSPPPASGARGIETKEVEILNDKGEVIGKQVVEKHSGFHTSEASESLLGKRKGPPMLNRGVIYDKDGHAVSLGGSHQGEGGLVSSK